MPVLVDVQYAVRADDIPRREQIESWAAAALGARQADAELTVRIVGSAESASLNETYRHKVGPTNVLSFPFEAPPGSTTSLLGDVVICADVVREQAHEYGKVPEAHWAHMVIHGVLHLLGYDHGAEDEAAAMEALETSTLERLGFPDPYLGPA